MWGDLAALGLQVRPFDGPAPPSADQWSRFQAPLRRTLTLLRRELEQLQAKNIVIELDVTDRDIRLDGYPRANARIASPAVRVTFDSRYGPLRYETAEYRDWQDNLRAIALSMESLRAVDRYGVSKRGEQYRGWKQLASGAHDNAEGLHTVDQARQWLIDTFPRETGGAETIGQLVKRAIRLTHPDLGQDRDVDLHRRVLRAKELIEA